MKLVLMGLVMIASLDLFGSDDSDYKEENSYFRAKKSNNQNSKKTKLIGIKGRGNPWYQCLRCDHQNYYSQLTKHMHNGCFNQKLPCLDCPVESAPMFEKIGEIYSHNRRCHLDRPKWQCIACHAEILQ